MTDGPTSSEAPGERATPRRHRGLKIYWAVWQHEGQCKRGSIRTHNFAQHRALFMPHR